MPSLSPSQVVRRTRAQAPAEFIRAFSVVSHARRIQPGGKAGDAQRQFLFLRGGDDDAQRAAALGLKSAQERLINGAATKPAEAAVRELGELLGFVSTRPDAEDDTGPDVLWRYPERAEGVPWS